MAPLTLEISLGGAGQRMLWNLPSEGSEKRVGT